MKHSLALNGVNRFPSIFLVLLSFFPLLNIKLLSIFSFFLFISVIFTRAKTIANNFRKRGCKPLLINSLFYLILVISLIYSPVKLKGVDFLIRQIGLLLFPVILIYALDLSKNLVKLMVTIFVISNLVVVGYFVLKLNLIQDFVNDPQNFFNVPYFLEITETDYKDWHATYIALNNLIAVFILVNSVFNAKTVKIKMLFILMVLIFLGFSLILNSRTIFLIGIIVLPLFIIFKFKKNQYRLTTGAILLFVMLALFKISNTNKLGRIFEHPITYYVNNFNPKTLLGVRYIVQKSSIELISRKPVLGYGIGYEKLLLEDYCIETKNFKNIYLKNYSSHNVYLSVMFSAGIFALLALLLLLANNFYLAFKKNDLLYLSLLIVFALAFLTENYFIRLNGILIFGFTNSYFYNKNKFQD